MDDASAIESAVFALLEARRPGATICPSEAARKAFGDDWRNHMDEVRKVASRLAGEGRLVIKKHGEPVSPGEARGPIRLGLNG